MTAMDENLVVGEQAVKKKRGVVVHLALVVKKTRQPIVERQGAVVSARPTLGVAMSLLIGHARSSPCLYVVIIGARLAYAWLLSIHFRTLVDTTRNLICCLREILAYWCCPR